MASTHAVTREHNTIIAHRDRDLAELTDRIPALLSSNKSLETRVSALRNALTAAQEEGAMHRQTFSQTLTAVLVRTQHNKDPSNQPLTSLNPTQLG